MAQGSLPLFRQKCFDSCLIWGSRFNTLVGSNVLKTSLDPPKPRPTRKLTVQSLSTNARTLNMPHHAWSSPRNCGALLTATSGSFCRSCTWAPGRSEYSVRVHAQDRSFRWSGSLVILFFRLLDIETKCCSISPAGLEGTEVCFWQGPESGLQQVASFLAKLPSGHSCREAHQRTTCGCPENLASQRRKHQFPN